MGIIKLQQFIKIKVAETYYLTLTRILLAVGVWFSLKTDGLSPILFSVVFFSSRVTFGGLFPRLPDAVKKETLLLLCQFLGLTSLILFYLFKDIEAYSLIVIPFILLGFIDAYYAPTVNALIPDLVAKDKIPRAYRISFFMGSLANTVGLALGFLGYEYFNNMEMLAIYLLLGTIFTIVSIRNSSHSFDVNYPVLLSNPIKSFAAFSRIRFEVEWSIGSLIINLVVVAFSAYLIPVAVESIFKESPVFIGFMEGCISIGVILGALFFHSFLSVRINDRILVLGSLALISVCFFTYAFALDMYAWLIISVIVGVAIVLNNTTIESKRSVAIVKEHRGMFQTIHSLIIQAGIPFGLLISYFASLAFDVKTTLIAGGALLLLVVLYLASSRSVTHFLNVSSTEIEGYYERLMESESGYRR